MAIRNRPKVVHYVAWDTVNNRPKTGDAANHTLRIASDLQVITPTNSPSELDEVYLAGVYAIQLTAEENSGESISVGGISSTPGVEIISVSYMTETPASIWSYAHRSLTNEAQFLPPRENRVSTVRGNTLELTWSIGDITGVDEVWFTAKRATSDPDQESILQIRMSDGLVRLNKHAADTALGSITVLDESAGTIEVWLAATASDEIAEQTLFYDIRSNVNGVIKTYQKGLWTIVPGITVGKFNVVTARHAFVKGVISQN